MRYVIQARASEEAAARLREFPGVGVELKSDVLHAYCGLNAAWLAYGVLEECGTFPTIKQGDARLLWTVRDVGNSWEWPAGFVGNRSLSNQLKPEIIDSIRDTPFQFAGYNRMTAQGGGEIRWPTGVGKTRGGVAVGLAYPKPRVIVTKAAQKRGYLEEIRKSCVEGSVSTLMTEGLQPFDLEKAAEADFVITAYETLAAHATQLVELMPQVTVIDEIHNLQSKERYKAVPGEDGKVQFFLRKNRATAARDLSVVSQHIFADTATPLPDRPRNLWAQLDLLEPGAWGRYARADVEGARAGFTDRYCARHKASAGYGKWNDTGASNIPELKLRWHSLVHDVPSSVAKSQIPRVRRKWTILTRDQQCEAESFREEIFGGDEQARSGLMQAATRKRPYIVSRVEEAVAAGEKVAVFTGWRRDAEKLASVIAKKLKGKCPVVLVHAGKVVSKNRLSALQPYIEAVGPAVLVATGASAGEAVDGLQVTSLAIFAMLPFRPLELEQWEGRFERWAGISGGTLVEYVIAEGTYDENVAGMLYEKAPPISAIAPSATISALQTGLLEGADVKAFDVVLGRGAVVSSMGLDTATEEENTIEDF